MITELLVIARPHTTPAHVGDVALELYAILEKDLDQPRIVGTLYLSEPIAQLVRALADVLLPQVATSTAIIWGGPLRIVPAELPSSVAVGLPKAIALIKRMPFAKNLLSKGS